MLLSRRKPKAAPWLRVWTISKKFLMTVTAPWNSRFRTMMNFVTWSRTMMGKATAARNM